MQRCWAGDSAARPSFRFISQRMEKWSHKEEDGKLSHKFIFKELENRQNENIEREGKSYPKAFRFSSL